MKPILDQPYEMPKFAKPKQPWGLIVLLLSIPCCLGSCFVLQIVGNNYAALVARKSAAAENMYRAFKMYSDKHDGQYPSFRDSADITQQLSPLALEDYSRYGDEDDKERQQSTLTEFETNSKEATWNPSLSGAKEGSDDTWVFYLSRNPDNRFILYRTSGTKDIQTKEQLALTIGKPAPDP